MPRTGEHEFDGHPTVERHRWDLVQHELAVHPPPVTRAGGSVRTDDVEICARDLDRPYDIVGPLRVRAKQKTAFSPPRTTEDVDAMLREQAIRCGANAVINVEYRRRRPFGSYKALDGTGTAVVATELYRGCPSCRERMRRDASVCPHCRSATEPWIFHAGYWWIARQDGRYYLDPNTNQWVRSVSAAPSGGES